jgi:hypothetical protein
MKTIEIVITEIFLKDKEDIDTDYHDLEDFPTKDEVNDVIGTTIEIELEDDDTLEDVEGIREIYIGDEVGYIDGFIESYEWKENN